MKECPIIGCHTVISKSAVMCGQHWRKVPQEIRNAIKSQPADSDIYKREYHMALQLINSEQSKKQGDE